MIAVGLGPRLRQARELADYSQQEVAELLGVAREILSYWENDRRLPNLVQLTRLAKIYGVSIESLFRDDNDASPAAEEHGLFHPGLRAQSASTRTRVRRWLVFLDEWTDLLAECGEALPGRGAPPERRWRAPRAVTDSRRAARLAEEVRAFYLLGGDAVPDLFAFLDQHGVLVYRIALDRIGDGEGVSGVFYNHPQIGYCILVNTCTTPGRQAFTLAHEFAHALFHYQERGLVSRLRDADRKERFADTFAAHFLVPGQKLRNLVGRRPNREITSPLEVLQLQRYFHVSYATVLNRLREEGLLARTQYEEYRGYSPSSLAARLGFDTDEYYPSAPPGEVTLSTYPSSVLDRIHGLVQSGALSPAGAAGLLQVSPEEILNELLAAPQPASTDESREFAELPHPMEPRTRVKGW